MDRVQGTLSGNETNVDAQQLLEEMEQKEEQLRLAAEFGQNLLEKNQAMQDEKADREAQLAAAIAALEDNEYRIRELSTNSDRLGDEARERDGQLREARDSLQHQQQVLEERLAAVAATDQADAAAAAQLAVDREKARAAVEIERLQRQAQEIRQQEAETRLAREMEETERIEAQKQKRASEKQVQLVQEAMQAQNDDFKRLAAKLEAEQARAAAITNEDERKHQEIVDLQTKLASMERQLAEARTASSIGGSETFLEEIPSADARGDRGKKADATPVAVPRHTGSLMEDLGGPDVRNLFSTKSDSLVSLSPSGEVDQTLSNAASSAAAVLTRSVFVNFLSANSTEDTVRAAFGVHGPINTVELMRKKGQVRGKFAYIEYAEAVAATRAIAATAVDLDGVALTVLPRKPKAEPKKKGIGRPQGAQLVMKCLGAGAAPTAAHTEHGDSAAAAQHARGRHVTQGATKPAKEPAHATVAVGIAAGNVATSNGQRASISLAKGGGGGSKPRVAGPLVSKENHPAAVDHSSKPGRNGKGRRGGSKQSAGNDGSKRRDTHSDGSRRNRPQTGAAPRRVVKQSPLNVGITSMTLSADGMIQAARATYGEPTAAARPSLSTREIGSLRLSAPVESAGANRASLPTGTHDGSSTFATKRAGSTRSQQRAAVNARVRTSAPSNAPNERKQETIRIRVKLQQSPGESNQRRIVTNTSCTD
jgi:hypothetical protein